MPKLKLICEVCGQEYEKYFSQIGKHHYCSRQCYNKIHCIKNKERECPTCHEFFIAKSSNDKYCCWDCYINGREWARGENHPSWKGGMSKLNDKRDSPDYKKWRNEVYKRDNYCCVKCKSKIKINAHHIKSWKYYPELRYEISNGVTLCEKCHIKLHQEKGYNTSEDVI